MVRRRRRSRISNIFNACCLVVCGSLPLSPYVEKAGEKIFGFVPVDAAQVIGKTVRSTTFIGPDDVPFRETVNIDLTFWSMPLLPIYGNVTIDVTFEGQQIKQVLAIAAFPHVGLVINNVPQLGENGIPGDTKPSMVDIAALKRSIVDLSYTMRPLENLVTGAMALNILDQVRQPYDVEIADIREKRKAHDLSFGIAAGYIVELQKPEKEKTLIPNAPQTQLSVTQASMMLTH